MNNEVEVNLMKGQVDTVCKTDVVSDLENDVWGGGSMDKPCEFKRGVCKEHNMKGNRVVVKSQKWAKKKTGFGWVTSSKVTYTCNHDTAKSSNHNLTENSTQLMSSQSPASNSKKQGAMFRLSLDNISGVSRIESESLEALPAP